MSIEKITERARKLLAMANDVSSPNEAAIAAKRARALMDKHGLKLADLMSPDNGMGHVWVGGVAVKYQPKWEQDLTVRVADFNDCIVRRTSRGVVFMGQRADAEMAAQMYKKLRSDISNLCRQYTSGLGLTRYNARVGTKFKEGAAMAIGVSLEAAQREREGFHTTTEGQSIVVLKMQQVREVFGDPGYMQSPTKSQDEMPADEAIALSQGYLKGRAVRIQDELD